VKVCVNEYPLASSNGPAPAARVRASGGDLDQQCTQHRPGSEVPLPHSCANGSTQANRLGDWLGINRSTVAVLIVGGGLGLSEDLWRNFLGGAFAHRLGPPRVLAVGLYLAAEYLASVEVTPRLGAQARRYYHESRPLIEMMAEDSQPALWALIEIYSASSTASKTETTTSSPNASPSPPPKS
jgi:hypothetical protein